MANISIASDPWQRLSHTNKLLVTFGISLLVSIALPFYLPEWALKLEHRVEETSFLLKNGIPIYGYSDGLPMPLLVALYDFVEGWLSAYRVLLALTHAITGYYVYLIARRRLGQSEDAINATVNIYGKSASALTNMAIVASIYHAIEGDAVSTMLWHAISVGLNLHPVVLTAPLLVATYKGPISVLKQLGAFTTVLGLYLIASYHYANGWEFMGSTFGCRLFYKLLTPNIGLYWYLFSQVFEFFRPLFTNFLQALSLVYGIPIAIRFRKDPLFMLTITVAIHTLLQPYPTVAELGLVISLYVILHELGPYLQLTITAMLVGLYAGVLLPVSWFFWVETGSGNANYYYGVTVLINAALATFIFDTARAWLWREALITNPDLKFEQLYQK